MKAHWIVAALVAGAVAMFAIWMATLVIFVLTDHEAWAQWHVIASIIIYFIARRAMRDVCQGIELGMSVRQEHA